MRNLSSLCMVVMPLLLFSCKKDIKEATLQAVPEQAKSCECTNEIAFPEIKGERVTFTKNGKTINLQKKGNYYVYLGDILLTEKQVSQLKNAPENARTATNDVNRYWSYGIVYYTINSNLPNQSRVTDAIAHWESTTSIRFVLRTNQPNYVEFDVGSGCGSQLGMVGGKQVVLLASACTSGNAIHEIGHTIGFFHEQSRTDRGNAIIINSQNIQSGFEDQFETYTQQGLSGFQLGAFDFGSVMLYDSWAFSNNGLPTITRLDGTTFFTQRVGLSGGDIETVNFLYGPPYARLTYYEYYHDYQNGPSNEIERAEGGFLLNLYADAACTIPFTLTASRIIHLNSTDNGPVTITMNAGESTHDFPYSYYLNYYSEYGNVIINEYRSIGSTWHPYWR